MFSNLRAQAIVAALMLANEVSSTQTCLSCRRQDVNAGFLVSYSYCKQTDECIQDVWNYINRNCESGWERGSDLTLEACEAKAVACIDFESSPELATQYQNRTWTLPAESYCVIKIDATEETARVIFDSTSFLGVEEPEYMIGDVITVDSGTKEVTIYNGAESGQLTFLISFSGAFDALRSIAAVAATVTLINLF